MHGKLQRPSLLLVQARMYQAHRCVCVLVCVCVSVSLVSPLRYLGRLRWRLLCVHT